MGKVRVSMLNPKSLKIALESEFFVDMNRLQKKYVAATDNLYKNTNSYPGDVDIRLSGGNTVVSVDTKLINTIDAHHIYAEGGTGIYMPSDWTPEMTERAIQPANRTIPRPGKLIGPRGKGSTWTDLTGKLRHGADILKGGRKVVKGIQGKFRLKDTTEKFLTVDRLNRFAQLLLNKSFRKTTRQMVIFK